MNDRTLYQSLLDASTDPRAREFLVKNAELIMSMTSDYDENGNAKTPLSATMYNDFYKWTMLPVIMDFPECIVSFSVDIREPWVKNLINTDDVLLKKIEHALHELKHRKFDKNIFYAVEQEKGLGYLSPNVIRTICGDKEPRSLLDGIIIDITRNSKGDVSISATGIWYHITWLETTMMQCIYETVLRHRLETYDKKSYVSWLSEALVRCIDAVELANDVNLDGFLFAGRRSGGYPFLILQNLYLSQHYRRFIGTSSVDCWYRITQINNFYKLKLTGTHAHELSMVFSCLYADKDKQYGLPVSQVISHYMFYLRNGKNRIPILPDTLGSEAFMKAASIISLPNGESIMNIFESARQDSGSLSDFKDLMVKYNFTCNLIASEIDHIDTLMKAQEIKEYTAFCAGGFFGDSETALLNSSDKAERKENRGSISMAVKAVAVSQRNSPFIFYPLKFGDGEGKLSINPLLSTTERENIINYYQGFRDNGKNMDISESPIVNISDLI